MHRLSREEACAIMINAQGLTEKNCFGTGLIGTINSIRRLGYVQLDTLAVVARAHHHTLWNRNSTYTEFHLDSLLREGKVFEYWSHAASYLPMEDFRFSLPKKMLYLKGHSHWFAKNKKLMRYVLDRVRAEGPLQSKDFETDRKRGSWFDWKPAKIALEQLFMEGSLMVKSRQGFQKVYDLAERVIPADVDQTAPTTEEYARYLVRSTLVALGVSSIKDFTHLRSTMLVPVTKVIGKMIKEGALRETEIEGLKDKYYSLPETSLKVKVLHEGLNILSPFDNLAIRRERLNKLFGWEYNLECYLPEAKRKYGYFCLPLLYRGKFVGMFDPKADRATGKFHVKQMHLVNEKMDDVFFQAFRREVQAFAAFNGCERIQYDLTVPLRLRRKLNAK